MSIPPATFGIGRLPRIWFGSGQIQRLPEVLQGYAGTLLLITGARSFVASRHWWPLIEALTRGQRAWHHVLVEHEPSPALVDGVVTRYHREKIGIVVGIGGGSVLDAAKAVAGLLPSGNSVLDHLEGMGRGIPYHGPALPFIAVPTTAGTGSEATKNAVLTVRGTDGYKKSFRHETLVPEYAVVDPELLASCPRDLIAANGMDAFTQLLESYVSASANPFTDAVAWSGMEAFCNGFWAAWTGGVDPAAQHGRSAVAYAAMLSGITLAQAGLGAVHGLAAPLGAYFPIPHGVACGTLLAAATRMNIRALQARAPRHPALTKYAAVGRLLQGAMELSDAAAPVALVDTLNDWTQRLRLPRLSSYGVAAADLSRVVANARGNSMRTNPLVLTDDELGELVEARL